MKKVFLIVTMLLLTGCFNSHRQIQIGTLEGISSLSLAKLMDNPNYKITVESDSSLTEKLMNGDIQIASLPTNLAASVYNKSDKQISLIGVNSLGGLSVIENGNQIKSPEDLKDKTLYVTQNSFTELVTKYLFAKHDLKLEYKNEDEIVKLLSENKISLAVLSEPYVSSVLITNPNLRIALDVNKEWIKISNEILPTNCIIARNDFISNNRSAINKFITDYTKKSSSDVSKLAVQFHITANEKIATAALKNLNTSFFNTKTISSSLNNFYKIVFDFDKVTIGNAMPDDKFYYGK